jgi:mono/diheme cytochrome c family protein
MSAATTGLLGLLFLGLGVLATLLMFQFWGYPYDKEKRKSACPQWKMNVHRAVGYSYAILYVVLMTEMVPRMWTYQIEFPARTVAHLMLGITIGVILLVKIVILRWFRHFEEWMPFLGVALLLCTFLLIGLSAPFVVKESALAGGSAFTEENRSRLAGLLPRAGFPSGTNVERLASVASLRGGREVLLSKCTYCHDLKTAILRPRTPSDWVRTVQRMAEKPVLGQMISDEEAQQVAAYLIAITPELQSSSVAKRRAEEKKAEARSAMSSVRLESTMPQPDQDEGGAGTSEPQMSPAMAALDPAQAKSTYEQVCSQCHELKEVEKSPPRSTREIDALITRMVENGLEEAKENLALVRAHLLRTFVNK